MPGCIFFALQVLEFELKSSAQSSYEIQVCIHGKFVESIAKEEALNHAHITTTLRQDQLSVTRRYSDMFSIRGFFRCS
jgi:hypothetical protein